MKRYHIKKFFRFEYSFRDVFDFYRANYRYFLIYHKRFTFLMRRHIKEQIAYRVAMMDDECYKNGACKICGCKTIHLQMANKACEGNCYPKMVSQKEWEKQRLHRMIEMMEKRKATLENKWWLWLVK